MFCVILFHYVHKVFFSPGEQTFEVDKLTSGKLHVHVAMR